MRDALKFSVALSLTSVIAMPASASTELDLLRHRAEKCGNDIYAKTKPSPQSYQAAAPQIYDACAELWRKVGQASAEEQHPSPSKLDVANITSSLTTREILRLRKLISRNADPDGENLRAVD